MPSSERVLFYGRDLCEWALGVSRTVTAAALLASVGGGIAFYAQFVEMNAAIAQIKVEISKGILPEADKMITRVNTEIIELRRDVDQNAQDIKMFKR